MLRRLVRMLRGGARPREAARGGLSSRAEKAAFRTLNAVAPLAAEVGKVEVQTRSSAPLDPLPAQSIVRREAVLGSDRRVAGYLFSLVYTANPRVRASSTGFQRLHDKVLVRNLQDMGIQRLLGHRLAVVDVSAKSLAMPYLEELSPAGTMYVVAADALRADDCGLFLARLRERGYRIGLRVAAAAAADGIPFVEAADFVFIDVAAADIPAIQDQMNAAARRAPAVKFVATNIQTLEEYRVCARLPFAFHHGPFVTRREKLDAPGMDAGRIKLIELLNKLRGDAELAELAALIKQNLALAYKLLRYINSPGMGRVHPVVTPEQALFVLGRQTLYRWLTLLLFTSGTAPGLDWAVMENALVRARLAELAAQEALSADERDELFVAGMFSLLDVVLLTPLEVVLEQVKLPAPVSEALLHRQGKYAPYLALAVACEHADNGRVAVLAQAVGLDIWRVNHLHLDAMLWAQRVAA